MYGDFPAKNTVYTPYIPINVWFWPTLHIGRDRRWVIPVCIIQVSTDGVVCVSVCACEFGVLEVC